MNKIDLEQYRNLFLDEMGEQLQVMDEQLMSLETNGESEEGIQYLFRSAHTIKGSSATMGFEAVTHLTHEMESVLSQVRSHQLKITPELIDLLFACLDQLKGIREDLMGRRDTTANNDSLISRLRAQVNPPSMEDRRAEINRDKVEYQINIDIAPSCEMKLARALVLYNKLQEQFDIMKCIPSLEEDLEDSLCEKLQIFCAATWSPTEIEQYISSFIDVAQVEVLLAKDSSWMDSSSGTEEIRNSQVSPSNSNHKKLQPFIRVNVERLENLMNLVGELVINQTRVHQVQSNLYRKYQSDDDIVERVDFRSYEQNRF